MKTESIKVYVDPWCNRLMGERECLILYKDDKFRMLFYNGDDFVELIIKNRNKIWHQWGFDEEPINTIKYLGGNKLAKYKQNLINQGFELMRKVEVEKELIRKKEHDEWKSLHPTTEENLDFLFNQI